MSKLPLLLFVLLAAAYMFVMPAGLPAQNDGSGSAVKDTAAEEIEEVENVEEIEVVDDVSEVKQAGLFQTIGRFHPVVLHFPIAWLILLVLVEMAVLTGFAGGLDRWATILLALTVLSFIPAIVSGLGIASAHANASAEFTEHMVLHRNLNIASALVLLVAGVVRLALGKNAGTGARIGYFVLVLAAAALMVVGSHIGGEMVWGEDFIPSPF